MKKAIGLALLLILAVTIGFYLGRHEYSVMAMTAKAKDKLDFTYKVPTYLPKGYRLYKETYTPPKETKYGEGICIVGGSVILEYQSRGSGYITFLAHKVVGSGGPALLDPKFIKVGNREILFTKTDEGFIYEWGIGRVSYELKTGKKFPKSEAKKVIVSVLE